jgi:uncharacterized protein (DUF2236 family)
MPRPAPIARKINREAVVLLGWGRAILLQLAHPLVAAAVKDNSPFDKSAGGYVRRVRRTVGGMLDITFGSPDIARVAIDRINAIHGRVRGRLRESVGLFAAGTEYSATDPELLAWVHATLVDSMILTYEHFVRPLTPAECDQFCAEALETGRALRIPDHLLPRTQQQLRAYLDQEYSSGRIVVGPDARALAASLLAPPLGPAVHLFRLTRLVTVGLLPEQIRDEYGFAWEDRHARAFTRLVRLVRAVRKLLPAVLREWPSARAA